MCGIVGFVGNRQAAPVLLDSLSKLEYRGYDSAGLAVRDGDGPIEVVKAKGRLKVLMRRRTAVRPLWETAVSGIPRGRLMESLRRTMRIPTAMTREPLVGVHMELLKIIRS